MTIYKFVRNEMTQEISYVKKVTGSDSYTIMPMNTDNTDYQEYLEWVAEGNTPMEADEETE